MSVCTSTVNELLRQHRHAILMAKRDIRNQNPKPCKVNDTWGLDMTGRADTSGEVHSILGIIDHGSRRLISLELIPRKSSWQLLAWLCLAIDKYGKPRAIRTDNEHCFTSKVFRFGLRIFGIRHQKTDTACPWQNGRIERFFGTLKQQLKQLEFDNQTVLSILLADFADFAVWYNHVRPHQNLGGRTPMEAWAGVDPYRVDAAPKEVRFVSCWDGLLCGFYMRR
jgi:putative transposase